MEDIKSVKVIDVNVFVHITRLYYTHLFMNKDGLGV